METESSFVWPIFSFSLRNIMLSLFLLVLVFLLLLLLLYLIIINFRLNTQGSTDKFIKHAGSNKHTGIFKWQQ